MHISLQCWHFEPFITLFLHYARLLCHGITMLIILKMLVIILPTPYRRRPQRRPSEIHAWSIFQNSLSLCAMHAECAERSLRMHLSQSCTKTFIVVSNEYARFNSPVVELSTWRAWKPMVVAHSSEPLIRYRMFEDSCWNNWVLDSRRRLCLQEASRF